MLLGPHLYGFIQEELVKLPGNYLEIGVFDGDGFCIIAKNFTNKTCYALDPFIEDGHTKSVSNADSGDKLISQKNNFLENTKDLTNVILFEETSDFFHHRIDDSTAEKMSISMILIDGSHHYVDVVNDVKLSLKLLKTNRGGIIIFDDLHVPGVKQAYDEFVNDHKDIIHKESNLSGSSSYIIINYDRITT